MEQRQHNPHLFWFCVCLGYAMSKFLTGCVYEPGIEQRVEAADDGYPIAPHRLPVSIQPSTPGQGFYEELFGVPVFSERGFPRITWSVGLPGVVERHVSPGGWIGVCEYQVEDAEDEREHIEMLAQCLGILGPPDEEAALAVQRAIDLRGWGKKAGKNG